jgi:predicted transcriptional regulator
MKGVRNGENVLSKKDLTPRERSTLLVLKHSNEPLSIRQLCEKTGYQSPAPFRASLRFLEAEEVITSSMDAKGEEVYSLVPAKEVN